MTALGTNLAAWWGATVASLVLLWDVTKWYRRRPRIKHTLHLRVVYPDSEVIGVTQREHGETKEIADYCHIELANVGEFPTTVMNIEAKCVGRKGEGQWSISASQFVPHGTGLPHKLTPGDVWSCRWDMRHLHQLAEHGDPLIHVRLSHTDRELILDPFKQSNRPK